MWLVTLLKNNGRPPCMCDLTPVYVTPVYAGTFWPDGKPALAKYRIIAYPMRHLKRRYRNWRKYRRSVSSLNTVSMKRKANAAWPIIKYGGGMHGIITWRWSCWQRYSWSSKRCLGASNGRCYPSNDLVTALAHMLPQRQLTTEDLADIIHKQHRRRLSAKKSSARRKVAFE